MAKTRHSKKNGQFISGKGVGGVSMKGSAGQRASGDLAKVMSMISSVPGGYKVEGRHAVFSKPKGAQEAARAILAKQKR